MGSKTIYLSIKSGETLPSRQQLAAAKAQYHAKCTGEVSDVIVTVRDGDEVHQCVQLTGMCASARDEIAKVAVYNFDDNRYEELEQRGEITIVDADDLPDRPADASSSCALL